MAFYSVEKKLFMASRISKIVVNCTNYAGPALKLMMFRLATGQALSPHTV